MSAHTPVDRDFRLSSNANGNSAELANLAALTENIMNGNPNDVLRRVIENSILYVGHPGTAEEHRLVPIERIRNSAESSETDGRSGNSNSVLNEASTSCCFVVSKGGNCKQQALSGYQYCILHILKDPQAPFKQCEFVTKLKSRRRGGVGKRCLNAVRISGDSVVLCRNHCVMKKTGVDGNMKKAVVKIERVNQEHQHKEKERKSSDEDAESSSGTDETEKERGSSDNLENGHRDDHLQENVNHEEPVYAEPTYQDPGYVVQAYNIPKTDFIPDVDDYDLGELEILTDCYSLALSRPTSFEDHDELKRASAYEIITMKPRQLRDYVLQFGINLRPATLLIWRISYCCDVLSYHSTDLEDQKIRVSQESIERLWRIGVLELEKIETNELIFRLMHMKVMNYEYDIENHPVDVAFRLVLPCSPSVVLRRLETIELAVSPEMLPICKKILHVGNINMAERGLYHDYKPTIHHYRVLERYLVIRGIEEELAECQRRILHMNMRMHLNRRYLARYPDFEDYATVNFEDAERNALVLFYREQQLCEYRRQGTGKKCTKTRLPLGDYCPMHFMYVIGQSLFKPCVFPTCETLVNPIDIRIWGEKCEEHRHTENVVELE